MAYQVSFYTDPIDLVRSWPTFRFLQLDVFCESQDGRSKFMLSSSAFLIAMKFTLFVK